MRPLRLWMVTAIAEEFIELIDDVTGKVVRCRKFVAPNPEWPLYFTKRRAGMGIACRRHPTNCRLAWHSGTIHAEVTITLKRLLISLDFLGSS
jgi:hypothetical protein